MLFRSLWVRGMRVRVWLRGTRVRAWVRYGGGGGDGRGIVGMQKELKYYLFNAPRKNPPFFENPLL